MLLVQIMPVRRQVVVGPARGIRTVETKRVAIVAVDIDSGRLARRVVTFGRCVVADQRHDDASVAELFLDIAHVDWIGEGLDCICGLCVFVLGLDQDDRSSICDLGFGNCGANVLHVAKHCQFQAAQEPEYQTYLSVAARKSGARVLNVPLIRWIHPGKPPPDTSALIYGPGLARR